MFIFVQEFIKEDGSLTGFKLKALVEGPVPEVRTFDITENVYNMQFDPFYSFPLIGEFCFGTEQDENGTIISMDRFNEHEKYGKGSYTYGSSRVCGSTVEIHEKEGYAEFTDFVRQFEDGHIAYYTHYNHGIAPDITDGMRIRLAPDARAYCLDWTKDETVMSPVSFEYVHQKLNENVYWIEFDSLYQEGIFDAVIIWPNYEKDPDGTPGDLAQIKHTKEEMTILRY